MPNLDQTGPSGQGPMTGRGAGNCGGRRGGGRFFGWCRRQPMAVDLKAEKKLLEEELKAVDEEIQKQEA